MTTQPVQGGRRVDVICLTYGEPPTTAWTTQYQYSLSILNRLTRRVAPIPTFITPLLAARRGLIRKHTFERLGYSSPLEEVTQQQAEALRRLLSELDPHNEYRVHVVCEFREPYIWKTLDAIKWAPPDDLIILPLYVAEGDFTSGISRTDLARWHAKQDRPNPLPEPKYLRGFGFDERFAKVLADYVWDYCVAHGWDESKASKATLILGSHGTLQIPPPGTNGSGRETRYLFGLIRKHLKGKFHSIRLGWLNHKLGGKWTFPEVAEAAREEWEAGRRHVVYFPFGFMGDNAESQVEGRVALAEFDWKEMLYLPCPNADESFMKYLAGRVIARIEEPGEEWEQIERGTEWLVEKERPAMPAEPGPLKFGAPALANVAALVWLAIGSLLTLRGVSLLGQVEGSAERSLLICIALLVGVFKGVRVLFRVADRNMLRLRRLPQPIPVSQVFSQPMWIMILFFMLLGMAIRASGLAPAIRAPILMAVGFALILGAFRYVMNRQLATPITERQSQRMPASVRAALGQNDVNALTVPVQHPGQSTSG